MCALIGVLDPYWSFYLHASGLYSDYSTGGAMFLLLLLVVVGNGVLGKLWQPLALEPHELAVVAAMMMVGLAITSTGLIGYLIPNITAPYYLASNYNDWSTRLWPHLRPWMSPLDPGGKTMAIRKFFEGIPHGDPIPWGSWVRPLAFWSILLLGLYACMSSLMVIMRKQWMDYEHLSFPIAQVPQELCAAAADPWRTPSVLASPMFWFGFAVPFAVGSLAGLHHYFPGVPVVTVERSISDITPIPIEIRLSFAVLGFTFLIPNRVAFSLWSLNILSFLVRCYMRTYGLETTENLGLYGAARFPTMAHLAMGAMVVFIAAGLWFARQHLARVLRCAMGVKDTDYDDGEPSSYRTALILLGGGSVLMTVWLSRAGLHPFYATIFVLTALLVFYGVTRVVVQCGVSVTVAPLIPPTFMTSTFGTANIAAGGLSTLAMSWVWASDIRTTVMSSAAHGMYLARRRAGHLLWALLLAALVAYAVSSVFTIWLGYHYGALNLSSWFFIGGPQRLFDWTVRELETGAPANLRGILWTGVGAAIMGLLVCVHRALFWWPIHPVGFIMCSVAWTDRLWFTIFLAWLVKLVVVQFGKAEAYRRARLLFLGMILGQFTVAGVWAIVDTFTQSVGNSLFWV
jgi:hypothetical protein